MRLPLIAAAPFVAALQISPLPAAANEGAAINIEWRRALAERGRIPKDEPVLLYCNTGTLSAQAGFALRVAGYENVRILQDGFAKRKAKDGFEAVARATEAAKH